MAFFKIVNHDKEGKPAYYSEEKDIYGLIEYLCDGCILAGAQNLYLVGSVGISNQILYLQNCSGKKLTRRARHFILSFDTKNWEREITAFDISNVAEIFCDKYFYEYQSFYSVHDNGKNRHAHIVVNPVSVKDYHILHLSPGEFKEMEKELALLLYHSYGVALCPISYINECGKLVFESGENERQYLYNNRCSPNIPLRDRNEEITVQPYYRR